MALAFISLSSVGPVSADTGVIYVNDSSGNDSWDGQADVWDGVTSGPKKSIKNATGSVSDGGIVNIANGVYSGENNNNITLNKNITIQGQSREGTIIDGTGASCIFIITNGTIVSMHNMAQINGYVGNGGFAVNNGTLSLTDMSFSDTKVVGGSSLVNGGNLSILNCNFINNTAIKLNESILGFGFIANGGNLTVYGCNFTDNRADMGGAIVTASNSSINSTTKIENCNFKDNSAYYYGGAIINFGGDLTVNNCEFANNNALMGGAIANLGNLILTANSFVNNSAKNKDSMGGAIANLANLTVLNNNFTNNSAYYGGAISNDGNIIISSSNFLNNIANSSNSSIYCTGGAIFNEKGILIINSTKFIGNRAKSVFTNTTYMGGAISNYEGTVSLGKCEFINNMADSGGAISNYDYLIVKNSNFTGNNASSPSEDVAFDGGAISNCGTSNIYESTFSANFADLGGAISNWGNSTVTASGSTFKKNSASTNGDAIYNEGNLKIHFCSLIDNYYSDYYPEDICNSGGSADARYNWWGSNKNPSDRVVNTTVSSWMVLRLTPGSVSVNNGGILVLTADLLHDVNGIYHDPKNGHVPDGIVVKFYSTLGTIGTIYVSTTNGVARSTLKGGSKAGLADVAAWTGTQTIHKSVKIDLIPPIVNYNYPKKYSTGISRTNTIYLKFSESIKAGINWSKIVVKDKYGKVVNITKWISGSTLYIKTSKRSSNSYYTVYVPSSAINDLAGNGLVKGYTIKFKTGR